MGLNIATLAVCRGESVAGDPPTQLITDRLAAAGHRIVQQGTIDDSVQRIRAKLLEYVADAGVDVVIVTAGLKTESCGVALDPLVTRGLHGFSDLLRMIAYQEIGSAAMLVDAEAAQCKATFVFILPSTLEAVRLALEKLLVPQLDCRTQPRNLAIELPRLARQLEAVPTSVATVDTQRALQPWIVPRAPGTPPQPGVAPGAPPRPDVRTAQRASMVMAAAPTSPSESMRMVVAKAATGLGINEVLPAPPDAVERKEPTNAGAPSAPPKPRAKTHPTISTPLPIKPPAKLIPLAELLPLPPAAAEPPAAEPARKLISLADLDDEDDDPDEMPSDVAAELRDPPPPEIAALFDDPPRRSHAHISVAPGALPARRTDDTFDDSPRRFAEPPQRGHRDRRKPALVFVGLALAAATTVLAVGIARRQGHEAAAAGDPHRNDRVAPRNVPPVADPAPPLEATAAPPSVDVGPVSNSPAERASEPPSEIDMSAPADAATTPAKQPRVPRPPRDPATAPIRDPANTLATAPVSKVDEGCDEVSCILDKYRQPCCAAMKPPEPANEPVVEKPSTGLPAKLDKRMVQEAMGAVKPAVIACGERFPIKGTVKLSVKVSSSGRILTASVSSSPDPELSACVTTAVKLAKFPETDDGGSFAYPFAF